MCRHKLWRLWQLSHKYTHRRWTQWSQWSRWMSFGLIVWPNGQLCVEHRARAWVRVNWGDCLSFISCLLKLLDIALHWPVGDHNTNTLSKWWHYCRNFSGVSLRAVRLRAGLSFQSTGCQWVVVSAWIESHINTVNVNTRVKYLEVV